MGEVALYGIDALRSLADLDGGRLRSDASGARVEVERGHVVVHLVASDDTGAPVFGAHAAAERDLPALEVRVSPAGEVEGELPSEVIDPDAAEALWHVGAATLRAEGRHVELAWDERPTRAQADAAVRLIAAIAGGGSRRGAFR